MNFTPDNARRVLKGTKTQTRRIIKQEHHGFYDPMNGGKCYRVDRESAFGDLVPQWVVGRDYAVCPGRGKKAVGRVRITAIRQERLQDISNEDAKAEGAMLWEHSDGTKDYLFGFHDIWQGLYKGQKGKDWWDNPLVWVLTFEVVL